MTAFRAFASALVVALLCGCAPLPGQRPFHFDGEHATFAGQELRDGDVVVSRVHAPVPMLLARHGPDPGEFSHAGVFARADDGTPMIYHLRDGGRRARQAKGYLGRHEIVGIYRHRHGQAPRLMARHLRQWLAKNDIRHLRFVLSPDPRHPDEPPHNCITFVNFLYLGAGLDRPFEQPRPRPSTAWDKEVSRVTGIDWTRLATAGTVARHPAFREVVVWRNPNIDPILTIGLETFADTIHSEVAAGKRLRQRAKRLPDRLIAACFGREDAEHASARAISVRLNLIDAWERVSRGLRRAMRRQGDAFTEANTRDLASKLALRHLDGFFE